jgi:hypothetical protein
MVSFEQIFKEIKMPSINDYNKEIFEQSKKGLSKILASAELTKEEKIDLAYKVNDLLPKSEQTLSSGLIERLSTTFDLATLSTDQKLSLAFGVDRIVAEAKENHKAEAARTIFNEITATNNNSKTPWVWSKQQCEDYHEALGDRDNWPQHKARNDEINVRLRPLFDYAQGIFSHALVSKTLASAEKMILAYKVNQHLTAGEKLDYSKIFSRNAFTDAELKEAFENVSKRLSATFSSANPTPEQKALLAANVERDIAFEASSHTVDQTPIENYLSPELKRQLDIALKRKPAPKQS